ncbi:MAG: hypothetical protein PVF83_15410 [Anaerolineales bacterium]
MRSRSGKQVIGWMGVFCLIGNGNIGTPPHQASDADDDLRTGRFAGRPQGPPLRVVRRGVGG